MKGTRSTHCVRVDSRNKTNRMLFPVAEYLSTRKYTKVHKIAKQFKITSARAAKILKMLGWVKLFEVGRNATYVPKGQEW